MNGILLIDKPEGYTSRDIVNIVGKKVGTKKVGHTGTLDPMATGVLAVAVGDATKLVELLMCDDKEYIAEITLGLSTDTLDSTGTIEKEECVHVRKENIISVLDSFVGSYEQEVPIYSAIKVHGKKLYEYARNHQVVELPRHKVTIHSIQLLGDVHYEHGKTVFQIKTQVSKGTYIRSLVRDIALKLNTVGVMSSLRRIRQGNFKIEDCSSLSDIENDKIQLLTIEYLSERFFSVTVDSYVEKMIQNGRVLENRYNKDMVVFKNMQGRVLALYKVKDEDKKLHVFKLFQHKI